MPSADLYVLQLCFLQPPTAADDDDVFLDFSHDDVSCIARSGDVEEQDKQCIKIKPARRVRRGGLYYADGVSTKPSSLVASEV